MSDQETKTRYRERDGINISTKTIVSALMILVGGAAVGGFGGMKLGNGDKNISQYVTKAEYVRDMSDLRLEIKDSVHRIELQITELVLLYKAHDNRSSP